MLPCSRSANLHFVAGHYSRLSSSFPPEHPGNTFRLPESRCRGPVASLTASRVAPGECIQHPLVDVTPTEPPSSPCEGMRWSSGHRFANGIWLERRSGGSLCRAPWRQSASLRASGAYALPGASGAGLESAQQDFRICNPVANADIARLAGRCPTAPGFRLGPRSSRACASSKSPHVRVLQLYTFKWTIRPSDGAAAELIPKSG